MSSVLCHQSVFPLVISSRSFTWDDFTPGSICLFLFSLNLAAWFVSDLCDHSGYHCMREGKEEYLLCLLPINCRQHAFRTADAKAFTKWKYSTLRRLIENMLNVFVCIFCGHLNLWFSWLADVCVCVFVCMNVTCVANFVRRCASAPRIGSVGVMLTLTWTSHAHTHLHTHTHRGKEANRLSLHTSQAAGTNLNENSSNVRLTQTSVIWFTPLKRPTSSLCHTLTTDLPLRSSCSLPLVFLISFPSSCIIIVL